MRTTTTKTICILGCGGFVGSHLLTRLLATTGHSIIGIDITAAKIARHLSDPRFEFVELNVHDSTAVSKHVARADIVISLVALCNPSLYNTIPLDVIDINFTRPLELVKACSAMGKWLIHFSTSEVYGRTVSSFLSPEQAQDPETYVLHEDTTPMILGAIPAQRWSYACAKQLLERTLFAYGFEKDLEYTVVRPFNFVGPAMDFIPGVDGDGTPRVLACFMDALMRGNPLQLVDGGLNRRCFTYIEDAVDAVMAILDHREQAVRQAFNVGHPGNEVSIAELARLMAGIYREGTPGNGPAPQIRTVSSRRFYGEGYEDSDRRVPDITKAQTLLGWNPKTSLEDALRVTVEWYRAEYAGSCACRKAG